MTILIPVAVGLAAAAVAGERMNRQIARFRIYARCARERGGRCTFQELAGSAGTTEETVLQDLRRMIRRGWFPQGRVEGTVFFSDGASRPLPSAVPDTKDAKPNPAVGADTAPDAIIRARGAVEQIRVVRVSLPGAEIAAKLAHIETSSLEILDYVEEHPDRLPAIRNFTEYYLPSLLKIAAAYREFDRQEAGESVARVKAEIRSTVETMEQACGKLLDHLLENDALDISTDIAVMKTMLARENLLDNGFPQA